MILGVKTNLFTANWHVDAWNADLDIKYYWSDPDKWYGTSGTHRAQPIACQISGTATTNDGKTIDVDEIIEFMNFFEVEI